MYTSSTSEYTKCCHCCVICALDSNHLQPLKKDFTSMYTECAQEYKYE